MTDSEGDAAPSRRRLRSVDTPETVVVRYSKNSWLEVVCGSSLAG